MNDVVFQATRHVSRARATASSAGRVWFTVFRHRSAAMEISIVWTARTKKIVAQTQHPIPTALRPGSTSARAPRVTASSTSGVAMATTIAATEVTSATAASRRL